MYVDRTGEVLNCSPGDVLTPTINITGTWLHKYVYVDWNRNSIFEVAEGTPGTTTDWGELVSANYMAETDVEGKDAYTSAATTGKRDGTSALPTFTVPYDASGEYRIRFKLDWYSTDPCGNSATGNLIQNNGGAIVDFTINVDAVKKTVAPVISLATGSNIQKGINEIGVTCETEGAVIYYTTDGSEPTDQSAQATNGNITIDASSANLQDKITVKVAAKATDMEMSSVVSAEYVVYPYCYAPNASSTQNWVTVTKLNTAKAAGYDLQYTNSTTGAQTNYLQIINSEVSGLRVKKGETFDLTYGWTNAWWSGFSLFMDKGTGTLEEIFYGSCLSSNGGDLYNESTTLPAEFNGEGNVSVTIASEASYGEYLIRAKVANTHDACSTSTDQKVIDIFYMICPAITVNAVSAEQGSVSVAADGNTVQLTKDSLYLIPAGDKITLSAAVADGYIFSKWVDANGNELSTEATFEYTSAEDITISAVTVANIPEITEDKEITANTSEDSDAAYLTVTVKSADATSAAPVWTIGTHTVTAQALNIEIAADATTPEISISDGGSIAADQISVKREVKADEWAFISLPFAINIADVTVGGNAAVVDDNIKFLVYDGAKRASTSIELFSGSGWTAKESGSIDANTGFAVAVNNNNGAEQTVTFTASNFTMDARDKNVSLDSYEATVNGGIDADWNFKGNPMLQSASKGGDYSIYVYNASDDTYTECASTDTYTFGPFVSWFVQSTGLSNGITFSHDGSSVASDVEDNISGRFELAINGGEDVARVTVLDGSSESYVINEDAMYFAPNSNKDAMYFAPNSNKVAQVYMIDGDGMKIASSVVPAPYNEVKLAYNAAVAGAQTLTVTSVIPGTEVYLIDNEEGTETQLSEGSEYTFTSAAGTNSERFVVKTIVDVTGVAENAAETSTVSAVVVGDVIKIYGATAGETINVYTVNSVLVASTVAVEGENEITVPAQGVLIVKVGDEVIKVIK